MRGASIALRASPILRAPLAGQDCDRRLVQSNRLLQVVGAVAAHAVAMHLAEGVLGPRPFSGCRLAREDLRGALEGGDGLLEVLLPLAAPQLGIAEARPPPKAGPRLVPR